MDKKIDKIVGASFEDLNTEDMEQVQGAGDVEAETIAVSIISSNGNKGNGSNGIMTPVIASVMV